MENINIIKGGLRQTVSQQAFEKLYKPNGWEIDTENTQFEETQETVKSLKTEPEIKNYLLMKKHEAKKFNDGLFKSDT